MAIPRLFYGGGEGQLYAPDAATLLDDTTPFALLGETNESAPAGPSGECIFPVLYLTTRRFGDVTLTITAIVDDVRLTAHEVTLAGVTPDQGAVEVTEIDLAEPYPSADDEQIRNAPRGSSIRVEIAATLTSQVDISVAQVEYEVVRESRAAVA